MFLIYLHLAPKNIALEMAVCLPCQECFIWFSFRKNPHTANCQLTGEPQRCLKTQNSFSQTLSKHKWSSVEEIVWGISGEDAEIRKKKANLEKLMISTKIFILSEG